MTVGARLREAMDARGPLCAGIDPHPSLLDAWGLTDSAVGLERRMRVPDAPHYRRVAPPEPPLHLEKEAGIYRIHGRFAREQYFKKGEQRFVRSTQFNNRADVALDGAVGEFLALPANQQIERLSHLPLGSFELLEELRANLCTVSIERVNEIDDSTYAQDLMAQGPTYQLTQRLEQLGFQPEGPARERVVRLGTIRSIGRVERWAANVFIQ